MKTKIVSVGFVSLAVVMMLSPAVAANPGTSGDVAKAPAATVQVTPGSNTKRITLTPRAAERLGIETGKVSEQPIVRKQIIGGLSVPRPEKHPERGPNGNPFRDVGITAAAQPKAPSVAVKGFTLAKAPEPMAGGGSGGFAKTVTTVDPQPASAAMAGFARAAPAPATQATKGANGIVERKAATQHTPGVAARPSVPTTDDTWVLITMTQVEWDRLAKDKPARLLPLSTRDTFVNEILARPAGMPPQEDSKRSMLKVYYVVAGKDHGLTLNKRMRVELIQAGSDETHKVVPYSAVYYDAKGSAWVYINPQPLVFERQRIAVERTVGDVAVLSEGPLVGTPIVTIGASLLYGVEIFGK